MSATASTPPELVRSERKTLLASVIVPVRNRNDDLRRLIEALERQTVPRNRFEILIGDDGSTDGFVDELATDDGWIRVFPGPPLNAYAARNRATAEARSPILVFVDSDCLPEANWLEAGLRALDRAEAVAGGIKFTLPERRTIWTLLDMEHTKDHETQVRAGNAETANLFVSRELFNRVGRFDDTLPGHGDFDFAQKVVAAGGRLVYAPEALVWHPARQHARSFLRMVWEMNASYGTREAKAGRRPVALKLRALIPFPTVVRARRRIGLSLLLDRRIMRNSGVEPSLREDLIAIPLTYFLLPYLRTVAQLRGWYDGKRVR